MPEAFALVRDWSVEKLRRDPARTLPRGPRQADIPRRGTERSDAGREGRRFGAVQAAGGRLAIFHSR